MRIYERVLEFDISKLKAAGCHAHMPWITLRQGKLKEVKINEAFLGTCTNGRLAGFEDCGDIY